MMLDRMKRFFRRENGVAAMELGLVTPVFLLLFLSITELGHMFYYSITIEKGMRSGVTYAARAAVHGVALDATTIATAQNLTMTGSLDPMADYLVKGYTKAMIDTGDVNAVVNVSTKNYFKAGTGPNPDINVTVVVVAVEVPYVPLMPFITENITGSYSPIIKLTHEQAVIGN